MTIMRLLTLNENLAHRFVTSQDADAARKIFENIFHACIDRCEDDMFVLLEHEDLIEAMKSGIVPENFDFQRLSNIMDENYFDAEDDGRDTDAATYFSLARLMSALSFATNATEYTSFADAAYEAIMALSDPQLASGQIAAEI